MRLVIGSSLNGYLPPTWPFMSIGSSQSRRVVSSWVCCSGGLVKMSLESQRDDLPQPRATPWVWRNQPRMGPEGAA